MNKTDIKFITPDNLYQQIGTFTKGMAVTRSCFEFEIPRCTLQDLAWNHMDQLHRHSVHNTYEKGLRLALGKDFALSLTQWGKWPLFITVTDVRLSEKMFYQSMTIAGIIFLHSIISFEEMGNDTIKLKNEWFIGSHKIFRVIHQILDKKLFTLNERLQHEDAQIRNGRFDLRNKGYTFRSDPPDYYNSNRLESNTIYPPIGQPASFELSHFTDQPQQVALGNTEFILQKTADHYLIWPAACPHEGGPLLQGKICSTQITCPWHGLKFRAAVLSPITPHVQQHGFEYNLTGNLIHVARIATATKDTSNCLETSEPLPA
jgi:hypothetical protein